MVELAAGGLGAWSWEPAARLRIWCRVDDHYRHHDLISELLQRARAMGLAGATVRQAEVGFGTTGLLRHRHLLRDDAPAVFEAVDRPTRIDRFRKELGDLAGSLVIVQQPVLVLGGSLP
ncbi:DUF190 domain-containing protein [Aciditerrimonas ferrireducens]|jgi:PII-like signaling protein|uniref:DUF190 domain-containing protein n=1 Tax=Aciditerrimonas ferrireducens TaxID=667306 RepID=UPI002006D2F1|nr:DUF190 domain-containing protein [Aciditerrimonas ferrireducens]MCK4176671.1 DUF190 domain-containing protein [Aciditerrimonas ferrireducens]